MLCRMPWLALKVLPSGYTATSPWSLNSTSAAASSSGMYVYYQVSGPRPLKTLLNVDWETDSGGCVAASLSLRAQMVPPAVIAPRSRQFEEPRPVTTNAKHYHSTIARSFNIGGCQQCQPINSLVYASNIHGSTLLPPSTPSRECSSTLGPNKYTLGLRNSLLCSSSPHRDKMVACHAIAGGTCVACGHPAASAQT